jgi:small subunit ribosomal protein S13
MVFIFKKQQNVNLKVYQMLKTIYGLGLTKIKNLLIKLGVTLKANLFNLKKFRTFKLNKKLIYLEKFYFYDRLKNIEINTHFNRFKFGTYKGIKLKLGLPLNGQNTKRNAKTFKRLNKNKGLYTLVRNKLIYERKKLLKKNKKK